MLAFLRSNYGNGVDDFLKVATGLLLMTIPSLLLFQRRPREGEDKVDSPQDGFPFRVAGMGLLAGLLVGMTSIGSGTITMMLLLLTFPSNPALIVGTDIVHAVILTEIGSFLHLRLGTVDPVLVAYLLIGSIPGPLLGTRLSTQVPSHWLKRILCGVLLLTGGTYASSLALWLSEFSPTMRKFAVWLAQ